MLDIKNATGCSKQGTCVTASKLLQMFYCNSWNCPPILWPLPLYTLYTYTICMCVCTMWNGRKNCWNAFAAWLLRWFFMIAARTQCSSCCSVQHDRDSNSNRNRDSDSDSCLCPMRGATMLFAVSQISWSLLECHRYFPFVFCLIFLSILPSLSITIYIWLSCLWLLWFYILHIQTVWRHSVSSSSLFRALSYAFTWNSCGWQLVQNYSSAKVSSSRFFPLFSAFSFFTFHFKVQKNLPKDKLSSAKVRAEF